MFNKKHYPAIYYVYGNSRYQDELEELCKSHFPMTSKLRLSNPNGCGFRIECYDQNDLSRFDVEIERYEAWIQGYRKTDFSDLNVDYMDLDEYIVGMNHRISYNPISDSIGNKAYINWIVNAHQKAIAIREFKFASASTTEEGTYSIRLGRDHITGTIPIGAAYESSKLIKKNLKGESFGIGSLNSKLTGFVIEYQGVENREVNVVYNNMPNPDWSNAFDGDINTKSDILLQSDVTDTIWINTAKPEFRKLNICNSFKSEKATKVQLIVKSRYSNGEQYENEEVLLNKIYDTHNDYDAHGDSWLNIDLPEKYNQIVVDIGCWIGGSRADPNSVTWLIWDMFLS
ncbi:MAG: hypothetical protein PHU69_13515 [Fermentimonas sp.]|nr:hypothetical protein [Fermentimonas sp.]